MYVRSLSPNFFSGCFLKFKTDRQIQQLVVEGCFQTIRGHCMVQNLLIFPCSARSRTSSPGCPPAGWTRWSACSPGSYRGQGDSGHFSDSFFNFTANFLVLN